MGSMGLRGVVLVLPLSTDGTGSIKVFNDSLGTVHFILDANGYFR